ncbi:adenosylcobalamin-dependent ribonucleoside-diphosphate reductase [Candidatus Gracilibacteria bacterium]|nr:adenosylcobalamin-dependent ribonucleoside-diphosphate reductase [Candidatus Gracilibacteria bacterium]
MSAQIKNFQQQKPAISTTKHPHPQEISEAVKPKGLAIPRRFTKAGQDPFTTTTYELRTSRIANPDGSVVFEMKNVEVPTGWSQVATDILAQKYVRKKGIPTERGGRDGSEWSAKQVVGRLAGTWRHWGEKYNYFATKEDAQTFEDEMNFMLIHQMAAPNSPQWFNTGLAYAYGITGEAQGHYFVDPLTGNLRRGEDAYTHPQPHACFIQSVKDDLVNEGGILDLMTREARLFKYGSGTGSNFSNIRGKNESLSGGGRSSGLMSFLQTIDRAAGAIKSGGTTRRAAKMVCLDIDHPEVEEFINWKVIEEQKVAALHTGSYICKQHLEKIFNSARANGIEPTTNPELKKLIKEAHVYKVPLNFVKRVLMLAEQKGSFDSFEFPTYDTDFRSEAYLTVSGQNSNNSIRISNEFLKAVQNNEEWALMNRIDKKVARKVSARKLWNDITYAAWACADPGLQYDTTINEWHTCPTDGRINASNPCSEYMFLDDTACNLASINLIKFYDPETRKLDVEALKHASRLWTMVLEISVLMAQFPSKEIAQKSYEFRTLGLGYANLGTVLMQMGIPYASEEAYGICGALTAIICGESYATSAEMAGNLGAFPKYEKNKESMLRVMRNHRRAAYNASKHEYEGLTVTPHGIQPQYTPEYLLESARECWDRALNLGEANGYRNAQVTVIAPTGTIGLIMDCDTTGIEPDFALVKFKKLVGGGYFKIVNQSVHKALKNLGYSEQEMSEIEAYAKGHGTLAGCPHINETSLRDLGFTEKELMAIETQLPSTFDLRFAFNRFTLGDAFCKEVLGLSEEQLSNTKMDLLEAMGYTKEQIEAANEYVCGTMTLEGAPHLKNDHYAVFDCANRCGKKGERYIPWKAHLRMMAAAQPFISGAISKTINMPEDASIEDVTQAYKLSWEQMLKAVALYRDGSKLSQPLSTSSRDGNYAALFNFDDSEAEQVMSQEEIQKAIAQEAAARPRRRKLPAERLSITHKFSVANHEGYVTIGLYQDGTPGEIFIKMSKEGSTLSGIMDALALTISLGLQYGVPLEVIVSKFTHSRFEPSGMTNNKNIPLVKSIIDYIGRYMALKFLPKEVAKKYHNEELIERAYSETNPAHLPQLPLESLSAQGLGTIAGQIGLSSIQSPSGKTGSLKTPSATNMASKSPSAVATPLAAATKEQLQRAQTNAALALNNDDAPICSCGTVMVRNGACYKCTDCGETSGCSG